MKDNWCYKLLKYQYISYCQGTADRNEGYALLYVPSDASFANNKSTLYQKKNKADYHEIDYDNIEDMTIQF